MSLELRFGYLLGSIPFGLILAKFAGLGDLRQIGSGNIGATNVLRTGNKGLPRSRCCSTAEGHRRRVGGGRIAVPTPPWPPGSAPFSDICFRSGSAFAAAKGSPPISACCSASIGLPRRRSFAAIWLFVAFATRYSSLAALAASAASVLMLALTGQWRLAGCSCCSRSFSIIRHAANIGRLARGEEARIGETKL